MYVELRIYPLFRKLVRQRDVLDVLDLERSIVVFNLLPFFLRTGSVSWCGQLSVNGIIATLVQETES